MSSERSPREIARVLVQEIIREGSPEISGILSRALTRLSDQPLRQGILDAFTQELESINIDQLWDTWKATRQPELDEFLLDTRISAFSPIATRVISQLKLGLLNELTKANIEAVSSLLIAGEDQDPQIAENAIWVLERLQDHSAQEEVCRWVIEHDHPIARRVALAANYLPKDLQLRALFFLLTEQWERYEDLDFDASLVSAVFQAANPELRKKISAFALRSGWGGYVEAITKNRQTRKLNELSDEEWQAILTILSRDRRGKEMWRLAQAAPVERCAQIIRELNDLDWQPENNQEKTEYGVWEQAAEQCFQLGKPVSRLPGEEISWAAHAKPVSCLNIRPQGDLLATGSTDHQVCIWETKDGSLVHRLQGHTAYIQSLATSPDGLYLASGSADRSVRIWDYESGGRNHIFGGHAGEVTSLVFSPDSKLLASGDSQQVRVWNVSTGDLVKQIPVADGPISQLAFDPNGAFIFASGQSGLYCHALFEDKPPMSIPERIRSWQIIPSSSQELNASLLITSSSYKKIRLWSLATCQQMAVLEGLADGENLCVSTEGQFVIASEGETLRRWQFPSGTPELDLIGHSGRVTSILCDPHGKFLLSAGDEGSVRLWHLKPNRSHTIKQALSTPITRLVMDHSGYRIAYSQQNRVTIHNLYDLENLVQEPLDSIRIEDLSQAESHISASPDTQVEQSWLHLIRLGVNWRNRYDIEISENLPAIAVGNYDIQLD